MITDFRSTLVPGKKFMFFDLESNCPMDKNSGERSSISEMEIIQIGYVVFDFLFNVLEKGSIFIKPEFLSEVSPYITELTGITQEKVVGGKAFKEASAIFGKIVSECECAISWGDYDRIQLISEFERRTMTVPEWVSSKLLNGKELVSSSLGTKRMGLHTQMSRLGIMPKGRKHDAEWDSINGMAIIESVFGYNIVPYS